MANPFPGAMPWGAPLGHEAPAAVIEERPPAIISPPACSNTQLEHLKIEKMASKLNPGEEMVTKPELNPQPLRPRAEQALWRCRSFFGQMIDCTILDASHKGHSCHSVMLYHCANVLPLLECLHLMERGVQEAPGLRLEKAPSGMYTLHMPRTEGECIEIALELAYTGTVGASAKHGSVMRVMECARFLGLQNMLDWIESTTWAESSPADIALTSLIEAMELNDTSRGASAFQAVLRHGSDVLSSWSFLDLPEPIVAALFSRPELVVKSETELVEAAVRWARVRLGCSPVDEGKASRREIVRHKIVDVVNKSLATHVTYRSLVRSRVDMVERLISQLSGSKAAWEAQQAVTGVTRALSETEHTSRLLKEACSRVTGSSHGAAGLHDSTLGPSPSAEELSSESRESEGGSGLRIGRAERLLEDGEEADRLKQLLAKFEEPLSLKNPPTSGPGSRFGHLHQAPPPDGMTPDKLKAGLRRLLRPLILPQIRLATLSPSALARVVRPTGLLTNKEFLDLVVFASSSRGGGRFVGYTGPFSADRREQRQRLASPPRPAFSLSSSPNQFADRLARSLWQLCGTVWDQATVVQVLDAIDKGCDGTTVRRVLEYKMAIESLHDKSVLRPALGDLFDLRRSALTSLAGLGCFLPDGMLRRQLLKLGAKHNAFRLSMHGLESDEFAREQLDITFGRVPSARAVPSHPDMEFAF